jgi:Leucine-rich repeat (LRR) protein
MRAGATTLRHLGCLGALCGSLLLCAPGRAAAAIPASERAALIAIYNSTNGAGWSRRANWRNAEDTDFAPPGTECTWYGVLCDGPGNHVTSLDLHSNQLIGSVPPEIGNLPALTDLDLSYGQLTGPIPLEIGNLSQLTDLSLSDNQLSGPIPPELGNLSHLTSLYLVGNQLTGPIPPEIGSLSQLRGLYLGDNQLTGSIPPQIGNLSQLTGLSLSSNQLTGSIPPQIGNLTQLGGLNLSSNQLTGSIPPQIGSLTQLGGLNLSNNQLTGPIPPQIGNLREVSWVELENNQLTGPIPAEIANLGVDSFYGFVERLYLDHNKLDGLIPPEIGNLQLGCYSGHDSGHLRIDHNQLSGPIPPEIGGLCMGGYMAFGAIELDHNLLSGPIPPEIGGIGYVGYLSLDNNRLTGPIPPQIGNLVHLSSIRLQGNRLSGPIPAAFMNLTRLSDGESDLRWNALHTSDAALRAFLDSKQIGHDWEGTQTVAPTGLAAGDATLDSVSLSWWPIPYTGDGGGYRIWYGTQPGGPYTLGGTTADKTVSAFVMGNLGPGRDYFFTLDAVTEPHSNNPNAVASERGAEVSAVTTAVPPGWYGLTVAAYGRGTVTSSPGAIACGGACHAAFWPGASVVLTANAEDGSAFLGWGGACAGTALTCDLTMDSEKTVTATFSTPPVSFHTVAPCRAYDSRNPVWASPLRAGTYTQLAMGGRCGIPATAKAVSLNVTVVSPSAGGHLRLYASGTPRPGTSSINYVSTRANNAVVSLGVDGAVVVYVSQPNGTAHVVLDVTGFFQ